MRRLTVIAIAALLVGAATTAFATRTATPQATAPAANSAELTVVELFTSQGCSSCPPANANLLALSTRADLLALSWGVTYWDQLGWKDTFASDVYTRRQRDYQRGLGTDNVWTPQIVVDGRHHVVGQRMAQIQSLIARHEPFDGPAVVIRNGGVGLGGGTAPSVPADVWLVRYEPAPIEVPVARGENGGRTLPHANVVRELVRLGDWKGSTEGFKLPPAARPDLNTAVLVQAPNGGQILAVGRV